MNEFGEPNMGNPSVRFDEGRESVGHWPLGLSIHPLPPTLRKSEGEFKKAAKTKAQSGKLLKHLKLLLGAHTPLKRVLMKRSRHLTRPGKREQKRESN